MQKRHDFMFLFLLILIKTSNGIGLPSSLSKIDPEIFDFWKLDVLVSNIIGSDSDIEAIKDMHEESNFFIRTGGSNVCDSRELKIISQIPIEWKRKNSYFKDPCESILVVDQEAKPEFYPNQPYFYWFNGKDIFEIQIFSKMSIKIASFSNEYSLQYFSLDVFQRRTDFNGAKIISNFEDMKGFFHFGPNGEMLGVTGESLTLFKEKFNFSIEWYKGTPQTGMKQPDGSWNGFIGALISGDLDVNLADLGFTPDRIEVVSPGFARSRHHVSVVYKRSPRTLSGILAIFQIFTLQLWILIGSSLICFSVLLYWFKQQNFLECVSVVSQAYFGQEIEIVTERSSQKIMVFCLSVCGALLFWSYSGTLISNLTNPAKEPPFRSTEEFLQVPEFQLHTLSESGYYSSFVNKPKKEILKSRIDPFTYKFSETKEVIKRINNSMDEDINIGFLQFVSSEFKMTLNDDTDYCYFEYENIQDIPQMWVGWMYPYNSMIQPLFDRFTFQTLQGIRKIQDRYTYINYDCQLQKDFNSVNFRFVSILFYILITGVSLSLIFLGIEKICKFQHSR